MRNDPARILQIDKDDYQVFEPTKASRYRADYSKLKCYTDDEFAECLMEYTDGNYKVNCLTNKWLHWNGKIWEDDEKHKLCENLLSMKKEMLKYCKEMDNPWLRKAVKKLGNNTKNKNIIQVTANICGDHKITSRELDKDDNLLNLNNGTLDLTTREVREHRKEDLLTKMNEIDFDKSAICHKWLEFLDATFRKDADLIRFVQKLFGLILTREIKEQKLYYLFGKGANGKSILINVRRDILGSYAENITPEYMMQSRNSNIDMIERQKGKLAGKRLAIIPEVPRNKSINIALIKQLTGEESLASREIFQKDKAFEVKAKIILVSNHKPYASNDEFAYFRRVIMIPFENIVAEKDQDKDLHKKLKQELPGILNWAIEGLKLYRKEGFRELPEKIIDANKEYQEECDRLQEFIDSCCVRKEESKIKGSEFRKQYISWLKENHKESYVSNKELYKQLREKGITIKSGNNNATYCYGIELIK